MATWSTKWRWHTVFSADSVEWCPVEPYREVLVCGTYQLDKADSESSTKQKRLGRVHLFKVDSSATELIPIQTIDTSGILDQKWCYHPIGKYPVLAVVTSAGNVQIYRLVEGQSLKLEPWLEYSIGQDVLALSIDWSSNKTKYDPMVVISDSSGSVTVLKLIEGALEKVGTWKSHGFEAWIAAFNYWDPCVFYSGRKLQTHTELKITKLDIDFDTYCFITKSYYEYEELSDGGDDCIFKSYDVRVPEVCVTTNRSHEAGVTAVRSHLDVEYQLLTGSYDEKIRLFDTRSLKRCVTETNANGGVWRLKWHPYRKSYVLAACMYGGFRIVEIDEDIKINCEYMEHESIAYGADWTHHETRPLVATCSFYDCKLHISEVSL